MLWTAESSSSEEEGEEEDAEKADDEKKPKTKKVKETTYEWELLNDMKAIWLRNPKEVTDEEYTKFYHSLAEVNIHTFPSNANVVCDLSFLTIGFCSLKICLLFYQDFGDNKPMAWVTSMLIAEGDGWIVQVCSIYPS